jgi:hypothetical protein
MRDKETEFSWSGLFLVTTVCSFVFTGIIKMLDGSNSILFLGVGTTSFVLWMFNRASDVAVRSAAKKRKNKRGLAS